MKRRVTFEVTMIMEFKGSSTEDEKVSLAHEAVGEVDLSYKSKEAEVVGTQISGLHLSPEDL